MEHRTATVQNAKLEGNTAPARAAESLSVFVAFTADDAQFAATLVDVLRSLLQRVSATPWPAGAEPTSGSDEAERSGSDDGEQRVAALIDACDAFVFVVSPTAVGSSAWRQQLARAAGTGAASGRRLVPVLRSGVTPSIVRDLRTLFPRPAAAAAGPAPQFHRPVVFPEGGDFAAPFRVLAQSLGIDTRVDVFISYSRRDAAFADTLDRRLVARGRRTWVDRSDLKPSDDWMRAIKAGIEAADNFLFVISPDSISSRYCREEVEYATTLKKRIIPVLRSRTDNEIPRELRARQWISFQEADEFDGSFDRVVEALDRDADYAAEHTRYLLRALEWQANGKDRQRLLRAPELRAASIWLSKARKGMEPEPSALQQEFIRRSRSFRRRRALVIAGVSLVSASILGVTTNYLLRRPHDITDKDFGGTVRLKLTVRATDIVVPEAWINPATSSVCVWVRGEDAAGRFPGHRGWKADLGHDGTGLLLHSKGLRLPLRSHSVKVPPWGTSSYFEQDLEFNEFEVAGYLGKFKQRKYWRGKTLEAMVTADVANEEWWRQATRELEPTDLGAASRTFEIAYGVSPMKAGVKLTPIEATLEFRVGGDMFASVKGCVVEEGRFEATGAVSDDEGPRMQPVGTALRIYFPPQYIDYVSTGVEETD